MKPAAEAVTSPNKYMGMLSELAARGQSADDLAPGEVRIRSAAAGTEIVLRNNGRIDINGLLFINGMPYLGTGG